jgi:hypothetical protein
MLPRRNAQPKILSGWKDIANYLGKGVRTVQRYERELGLPIRRPAGKLSSVIATKPEIETWVATHTTRTLVLGHSEQHSPAIVNELRGNIAELRRLREHIAESRQALAESRHTLKQTLESIGVSIQARRAGLDQKNRIS